MLFAVPVKANISKAESVTYIQLFYEDKTFEYRDEHIEPSNHMVAQEIFVRKINAPYAQKMEFVGQKIRGGASYKVALLVCFPLLERTVTKAIEDINTLPTDSQIRFYPNSKKMFAISREADGLRVDEDRLYMDIYFALLASNTAKIQIPTNKIKASVTVKDNVAATNLRAKYSTDFSSSGDERKHNIKLALSKLNGAVIGSGETLSFNDKVGRRTAANGYKEAKIIKGGKYVPGVGGGVCQASTTLYNAALLSDLEIIEANRHTLQSTYEKASFDAMVNSGSSDLKIQNDGSFPVFVRAYSKGVKAYVEIYGTPIPYKIERKSEITYTGEMPKYDEIVDEKYEYFEQGTMSGTRKAVSYSHPEVHSKGYLLYYDYQGNLIQTKHIRTDKYSSVKGVIAIAP